MLPNQMLNECIHLWCKYPDITVHETILFLNKEGFKSSEKLTNYIIQEKDKALSRIKTTYKDSLFKSGEPEESPVLSNPFMEFGGIGEINE